MEYTAYRFEFTSAVHFGKGHLEDASISLCADTLFSALCIEAVNSGVLDRLVDAVSLHGLRISDAFPYCENTLYIPKPIIHIEAKEEASSLVKKKAKKLDYIPAELIDDYIAGKMDVVAESEKFKKIGHAEIRTNSKIPETEDAVPYPVGAFNFGKGWGLYIIAGYERDEDIRLLEDLLTSLEYSGIGGRRSSGMGRFNLKFAEIPDSLKKRLDASGGRCMALSLSSPAEDVLPEVLENASYILQRRAGFICSTDYADHTVKKQTGYLFKAGSVFSTRYDGTLLNVGGDGSHPVYRYALPMFMEV